MPLDARKVAHLQQVVGRSFAGRQRTIVAVSLVAGSYHYTALQVIMRLESVIDPQVYDASGQPPLHNPDAQIVAPLGTNFSGVVLIADTATATSAAVASAAKYQIIEVLTAGIAPDGSHLRVLLRRMR